MATYVSLMHFTDKGMQAVKDTVKRADAFRAAAKAHGVTVKEMLWVQGKYDVVTITEGPDETVMSALLLDIMKNGNVRGQTLRGMNAHEMTAVIGKMS